MVEEKIEADEGTVVKASRASGERIREAEADTQRVG